MSGNEVHLDGARVYLAPAGTAAPTFTTDLAAEGWLEFGRIEDDGIVTQTEAPDDIAKAARALAAVQGKTFTLDLVAPEPYRPNRAARRAAAREARRRP